MSTIVDIKYHKACYGMHFMGFVMAKLRVYLPQTEDAVKLLGELIKLGRKQKKWTVKGLAERANISRLTVSQIEAGSMHCSIGLVFELAALVGVNLFESDRMPLRQNLEHTRDKIAVLPKRIRVSGQVFDDF